MGTPAVGQQINFTQVYNFFTGSNPSGGSNIQLRGTLGALRQPAITTGPIRLSADLGNQNITYNVTASAGSASEGSTITFYINTLYVPNNTTLYYTLANVNTRDLDASQSTFANTSYTSSGATGYASIVNKAYLRLLGRYTDSGSIDYWVNNFLQNNYVSLSAFFADLTGSNEYLSYQSTPTETGTVTVNNASASKSFLIVPDYLTEGTESVTFQVRTDSHSGTLVGSAIVNLTDTYQDEGSPTISSFSTSATSVNVNNTVTLSWTTSNADVVRIYKNGSVYKAFNASTTSVVETISSDCNFTIYAWNGTNSTTGSTISITAVQPTPNWFLTANTTTDINEAGSINFTVSSDQVAGTFYITTSARSFTTNKVGNSATTVYNGGAGEYLSAFTITFPQDGSYVGDTTLTVQIRTGSASGTIVASQSVIVRETTTTTTTTTTTAGPTWTNMVIGIGGGGGGGSGAANGGNGGGSYIEFEGQSLTGGGGLGGQSNTGSSGLGGSVFTSIITDAYVGGAGAGAAGDTGGGGGGGLSSSSGSAGNSGGNGASAGSLPGQMVSVFNSQYGSSTAGSGFGTTTNVNGADNNSGNSASGWGAGGGGANWWGGNGGNGVVGGGGGGAASYAAVRTGGNGGSGAVCVIRVTSGTTYTSFYNTSTTISIPAGTTSVTVYIVGAGGGGAGANSGDFYAGGGGGAGGTVAYTWTK